MTRAFATGCSWRTSTAARSAPTTAGWTAQRSGWTRRTYRWWAFDGPDDLANGLCLCAIHHKLFDKGVLGLTTERTITVSARFVGRSRSSREMVLSLAGRPAREPQPGMDEVEPDHIGWHTRQVFRAPTRG